MGSTSYVYHAQASKLLGDKVHAYGVPPMVIDGKEYPAEPEYGACFANAGDLYHYRGLLMQMDGFHLIPNVQRNFEYATFGLTAEDPKVRQNYMVRMRFEYAKHAGKRQPRDTSMGIKSSGKDIRRIEMETHIGRSTQLGMALRKIQAQYNDVLPEELSSLKKNHLRVSSVTAVKRAGFNALHVLPDYDACVTLLLSQDFCATSTPRMYQPNQRSKLDIVGQRFEGESEAVSLYSPIKDLTPGEVDEIMQASLTKIQNYLENSTVIRPIECNLSKVEQADDFVNNSTYIPGQHEVLHPGDYAGRANGRLTAAFRELFRGLPSADKVHDISERFVARPQPTAA